MSDQENNHAAEPAENQDVLPEQPDDALLRPQSDDAGESLAEGEAGVESMTSGDDEWVEDPSAGLPEAVEPEPAPEPEPEPVTAAPAPAPELNESEAHVEGMDWYIIHTYSGFENKVSESLRARAQAYHFEDRLGRVLIPTEEVVELRNGKKVTSKRLLYPGYVMVQIAMDDEIWHHVKNTPRVTGFVGGGNSPVPLTADEVNSILFRQATAAERPRPKLSFEKNETVRIVDGPFASFQGKVDEINPDRNTLRVLVTIFGRATPVELEFLQVEKIT